MLPTKVEFIGVDPVLGRFADNWCITLETVDANLKQQVHMCLVINSYKLISNAEVTKH